MSSNLKKFEEELNILFEKNIKNRRFYLNFVFYISFVIPLPITYIYFLMNRSLEKTILTSDIQLYFSIGIYFILVGFFLFGFNFLLFILKKISLRKVPTEYKSFINKFSKRFCHSQKNRDLFINFYNQNNQEYINLFIKKGKVKSRKCYLNFNIRDFK